MPVQQISVKNTSDIEHFEWSMAPYATNVHSDVGRIGSSSSQTSYSNSSGDICRICHCESDAHNPLLAPCYCSGSLKYVHQSCLQQWLTASETRSCELCKFHFIMHTKIKPFNEWRRLEMSGVERRRLCCAVLFHCIAVLCVMWSLFVLIDRAAEEMQRGLIAWPFWTKLVVVTVGFTGGAVFMYIQCRQYLHLCNRWRAHNRILLIQNAPEKCSVVPPSPVLQHVTIQSSRRQRDLDRLNHGQVVANIENNPHAAVGDNNSQSSNATRQLSVEHHPAPDENAHFHKDAPYNPINSSTTYKEEDESGGFETYKFNVNRRISALDTEDRHACDQIPDRRYSDTRLLQSFDHKTAYAPRYQDKSNTSIIVERAISEYNRSKNCENEPSTSYRKNKSVYHISKKVEHPCGLVRVGCDMQPQVSDINFICEIDPLEFNIRQMLELDAESESSQKRKKSVLSLNQNQTLARYREDDGGDSHRSVFKSLPNLSSSSENLLPHKPNS